MFFYSRRIFYGDGNILGDIFEHSPNLGLVEDTALQGNPLDYQGGEWVIAIKLYADVSLVVGGRIAFEVVRVKRSGNAKLR